MILNIGGGGGLPIRLIVTAPTGSAVSVTRGTTVLAANEVDGVWTFAIPSLGVWTIHATIDGQSLTQDVDISKVGQYNVTLEAPVKTTLNDNDWATIKEVADESKGANYWAVGDTKEITINGKVSDGLTLSNYSTWVYIIGFDHNSEKEGTGIAFQGFKTAQTGGIDVALCDSGYNDYKTSGQWFNMNNNNSTNGGWRGCNMRNNTLPLVKAALPAELTSVIKTTSIYTDNTGGGVSVASYVTATQDTLYLLAEFEISGAHTYANTDEQNYQKQYAYYAVGNSKVKYRHNSTAAAAWWWDRSVNAPNINSFSIIASDGSTGTGSAIYSFGLAPAFKVGGAKYTPLEYIQSTGTQYVDTGVAINSTTYNKLEFEEDVLYPSLSSTYYLVNGASGSNVIYYYGLNNSNGAVVYGDGTADKTTSYTVSANERYTVVFSPATGKYTFGSNPSVSFTPASMAGNSNFYVFAYNKGSTQDCHSERLYRLKIRMDGELIRDFIPAKDEVGNIGLYDNVGKKFYYNSGTGTFAIPGVRQANSVGVGASLFAEEDGTKTEFIVVNQGNPNTSKYDSTCDGTWLVRKDIYGTCTFGTSSVIYDGSIVDQEMERYLTKLNISSIIKTVNVPVIKSTTELSTSSVQCFALSAIECGVSSYADGARLSYFAEESNRIAYYNGVATAHWTRSPYYSTDTGTYNSKYATLVTTTGTSQGMNVSQIYGYRPAFIIPSDTYIDEDNNILTAPPL